jgi:hypothetical protein
MITEFKQQTTISLFHQGDCSILGLSPDGSLYAEEFYDENFIAQYHIRNRRIIATIDEDAGQRDIVPFSLPDGAILPDRPPKHPLNYRGLRYRGLREEDHLQDWIMPLHLMEKMPLLSALSWGLPPMLLLGIAESQVLSQAQLDEEWLVCRRLLLAFALPERRYDDTGLAYDYDSRAVYLLHSYSEESIPSLHESLHFGGEVLQRPMDILCHDSQLILADGGDIGRKSRLLLWEKEG